MSAELDKLENQKNDLSNQITDIFKKKDELREEFFKQKYEVKMQQDQIKQLETKHKKKNRLIEQEARKKEEEEKRKLAKENRPHPYLREIEICEDLVDYCRRIKGENVEESKKETKTFHDEMRDREIKDSINKQVKDKKIAVVDKEALEAQKQEDIFAGFGGEEKKKGKRNRGKKQQQ